MSTYGKIKRAGLCSLIAALLVASASCDTSPAGESADPASGTTGSTASSSAASVSSEAGETTAPPAEPSVSDRPGDTSGTTGPRTAANPGTGGTSLTTKTTKSSGTTSAVKAAAFEVKLAQYHPGIPGFDAEYEINAVYDDLLARMSEVRLTCADQRVRIDQNKVVVPESVRSAGKDVVIEARHSSGATARLTIPVKKWAMSFNDEFEGKYLDPGKWTPFEPGIENDSDVIGVGNGYEVKDGVLSLKVNNKPVVVGGKTYHYTVTAISTYETFSQKTGCFLARIKAPKESGVNTAFWLMPKPYTGWGKCYHYYQASAPNIGCGEIDILEYSNAWKGKYQTTEHFWDIRTGSHHSSYVDVPVENICTEFHVYGAVIEDNASYMYCDGRLVKVNADVAQKGEKNKRSLDSFMLLSNSIGDKDGGWLGAWDFDESAFPICMQVDWVRAYR